MIRRSLFTWGITTLLDKVEKDRVHNKRSENRGRKAWRWWSLLPSSSLGWLSKCFTSPACGLLLLWLCYSDLNVPRSPLSLCVPVGYPRPGTALPTSGWAEPAAHSSHRGAKCSQVSCWSSTVFFMLSFFKNYAIIKKNSQTKMNALLSPKRFQTFLLILFTPILTCFAE